MTAAFSVRVAERNLDVAFEIGDGETLAIVGPNGAGKSTIVSVLAGLLRPSSGRAELDGRVLFDDATKVWIPPHKRRIAVLAQEPLLFRHLDAARNVAFAPRVSGHSHREAKEVAASWLAEVDASELASTRPARLSGGQAQRVAIARALAADPSLLLLDEPMAALDVETVPTVRRMLRRVLDGRRAIVVTHDPLDAIALADRVLIVEDGHIVQAGATLEVLSRPRSAFAARFAGLNLLSGTITSDGLSGEGFSLRGTVADGVGTPGFAAFPPSAVSLAATGLSATIVTAETWRDRVLLTVELPSGTQLSAELPIATAGSLDLSSGALLVLAIDPAQTFIYTSVVE